MEQGIPIMNDNDATLLQQWLDHRDADAFATLVSRYSGMVHATCRRVLRGAEDSEDITQECFEALATSTRIPGDFLGAWLHRVATNRALNRVRSEIRRLNRDSSFAEKRGIESNVTWNDVYDLVDEAIAELPDALRIPLVAHFLQGATHAAIAETTGVSRQTIGDRIGAGLDRVRKSLERRGVSTGASALGALMLENAAEGAPVSPALAERLGKLAISGRRAPRPMDQTAPQRELGDALSNVLGLKPIPAVIAVIAVSVGLAVFYFGSPSSQTPVGLNASPSSSLPNAPESSAARPLAISSEQSGASDKGGVQEPSALVSPASPPVDDSIHGHIVNAVTGEPVKLGVTIAGEVTGGKEVYFPSGDDGSFRAEGSGVGYGAFTVAVKNYIYYPFTTTDGVRRAGQPTPDLVLRVKELPTISGRVLFSDGTPAPNASIMRRLLGGNSDTLTSADNQGAYTVHHDGGHWTLWARAEVLLQSEEHSFELTTEDSVKHDFTLPPSGQLTIELQPADGKVVHDIHNSVVMTPATTSPFLLAGETGPNRFLVTRLPYDVYSLEIRAEGYESALIQDIRIDDTSKAPSVTARLKPALLHSLLVRVVDSGMRPVADAGVLLEATGERVDPSGQPQAEFSTQVAANGKNTDAQGQWKAEQLPAGSYRAYCSDVRGRGEVLAVVPDMPVVTLRLEDVGRSVKYQVEFTDAATGVKLSPIDAHVFVVLSDGTLGKDPNLGHGTNRFIAIKEGYTAFSDTIKVAPPIPKDGVKVRATLGAAGTITGAVHDSRGQVKPFEYLYVYPADLWPLAHQNWDNRWKELGRALAQGARTDGFGNFSTGYLPEGNYVIALSDLEFTPEIRVTPGVETGPINLLAATKDASPNR
ncbi:MAG: RNA polymerase sigma factor [Candidatus Hydrogenedentes bacterium]|nr:RNA polymerase sigma factor [Candidatus Hydrogenedentota bacterium]